VEVYDYQRTDTLGCKLAPSFGTLTMESVKLMDDALKTTISGTLHTLKNIPEDERTWGTIMERMRQNSLFESRPEDEITRVKYLIREGHHTFKFDGSPDAATVNEVRVLTSWQAQNLIHGRRT